MQEAQRALEGLAALETRGLLEETVEIQPSGPLSQATAESWAVALVAGLEVMVLPGIMRTGHSPEITV